MCVSHDDDLNLGVRKADLQQGTMMTQIIGREISRRLHACAGSQHGKLERMQGCMCAVAWLCGQGCRTSRRVGSALSSMKASSMMLHASSAGNTSFRAAKPKEAAASMSARSFWRNSNVYFGDWRNAAGSAGAGAVGAIPTSPSSANVSDIGYRNDALRDRLD